MEPLLIWVGYGVIALVLGVISYQRAVKHRQWYECPRCGERFRAELMEAGYCNTCGTELRRAGASGNK